MDARTAEAHFKEADSLYRDGRYAEALDRLIELDEAYPNTPNVLFPLARCLRRVGRVDEALGICDDLITRCGDLRALELREYIRKSHAPEAEESLQPQAYSVAGLNQDAHAGVLDDLLGEQHGAPPPLPPMRAPAPSKRKYLIVGGIAAAVVLIVLPLAMGLMRGAPEAAPEQAPAVETAREAGPMQSATDTPAQPVQQAELDPPIQPEEAKRILVSLVVIAIMLIVAANTASLYLTLMITGKLPYDVVLDNLLNVAFMAVALSLLNTVLPCIGLAISFYVLYKSYEFTIVDFLIWFGMNIGVGFAIGLIAQLVIAAAGMSIA
ncbi:MAG: tetratricopeptide repeat protein [Candidatus Hydrogenedentes bacterium]|nr:tetratricopeptide repeat protein [Candidatus Hydrogenedentota bacterium]